MLILAVDTSGRNGGVALARGDASNFELLASADLAGGSYSSRLMPEAAALLAAQHTTLRQLDGFVVAAGPGSFTGLRVGLATVKALAEIVAKPIAAVSVLEAVAEAGANPAAPAPALSRSGIVFAALDAGRNEVYVAEYRVHGRTREPNAELLLSRAALVAHVRGQEQSGAGIVLTPDRAVFEVVHDGGLPAQLVEMPSVADIARLGLRKLLNGDVTPAAALDANYIRRSDAEIFSPPK